MPDNADFAEPFNVDVDQLAGTLALVAAARPVPEHWVLLRPRRRKMRLTVAGETPTAAAICLPV
jgi:hypothetical protein